MLATTASSSSEAKVGEDALKKLLDSAVETICSRQKKDLDSAVSTLQAEISCLQESLRLTQAGIEHQKSGASPRTGKSPTVNHSAPKNMVTPSSGPQSPARQRSGRLASYPDYPETPDTPLQQVVPVGDKVEGNQPCRRVSRSGSDGKSKYGYSAAQMMELLSGGDNSLQDARPRTCAASVLFIFVIISVVVSTLALGLSFDVYPQSSVWIFLETACVLVFAVEFVAKVTVLEKWAYFFGPLYESDAHKQKRSRKSLRNWKKLQRRDREAWINSFWNWFDFAITVVAVIDLSVTLSGYESRSFSMSMLRCLRLFRALRVVKLLRVPLVKDLMNIFFGLILGTPLLVGAFCLLVVTVYLAAILFRLTFGPSPRAHEQCPFDESMDEDAFSAECPQHEFFAYKYFGRVDKAMFTLFRCMTMDCSTVDGNSLIVIFSQGYGWLFDVFWAILTTWVVCGILNIIMASFVGKTSSELEARESSFVQDRLRHLAKELIEYAADNNMVHGSSLACVGKLPTSESGVEQNDRWPRRGEIQLSLGSFEDLLSGDNPHGEAVNGIIRELGMSISANDLFHVLDLDESGTVDAVEILDSLMMMSSIQKTGTVSTLIALHGLSSKMNEMSADRMSNFQLIQSSRRGSQTQYPNHQSSFGTDVPKPEHYESIAAAAGQ